MNNSEKHRQLVTDCYERLNRGLGGVGNEKNVTKSSNDPLTYDEALALDDANKRSFASMVTKAEPEILHKTTVTPKTTAKPTDWSGWDAWAKAHIENALCNERTWLTDTIIRDISQALEAARKEAQSELADEVRRLRIELAETQTTLAELRRTLADERGKVYDPPSRRATVQ